MYCIFIYHAVIYAVLYATSYLKKKNIVLIHMTKSTTGLWPPKTDAR